MKSKPLIFFVFFLIGLFVFFKIDSILRQGVLSLGDGVKGLVLDVQEWVVGAYQSHFNQAKTIEELRRKNGELGRIKLHNQELQAELNQILDFYHLPPSTLSSIVPVRAISYVEIGDYHRIWLKGYEGKPQKLYGLVFNNAVAGIAKADENGRMMGYLNGDPLCSYGVSIGRSKALGIVRSEKDHFVIDFIPLGSKIAIGDEVVTNGMDEIFSPHIPVGKITQIFEQNGYLSAEFSPLIQNPDLGYMWLLDRRE